MSLLAPLYALGILAVSLPLIFHLIQRRPRSEYNFSSLMFLSPSPPRLTRRSRLRHLLLLLLRATALVLLAIAFARPFLRSPHQAVMPPVGQRVVLLLDTSASMRREGLWSQVIAQSHDIVAQLDPLDEFALLTFDTRARSVLSFDAWAQNRGTRRNALARDALTQIRPTWGATDLGVALVAAVDQLREAATSGDRADPVASGQIFVVSDLQQGCQVDRLQSFAWPADVRLELRRVQPLEASNATLRRISTRDALAEDDSLSIRVVCTGSSRTDQFHLAWGDDRGQAVESAADRFQVPPGQNRTIRLKPHPRWRSLLLQGDEAPFDNTLYVAHPKTLQRSLLYVGNADTQDETPYYFLQRATLDTAHSRVQLKIHSEGQPLPELEPHETPLVVVDRPLTSGQVDQLLLFAGQGGHVLVVLRRHVYQDLQDGLRRLLEDPALEITEAQLADYAMLNQIDFQHPLFRPFADPRFNDFTKIHFWSHRRLRSPDTVSWQPLADFDDRDPALLERQVGRGRIWVLTSSWEPSESQLALSTKFVPLLARMFDLNLPVSVAGDYDVDQVVQLQLAGEETMLTKPNGETISISDSPFAFRDTQQPGIYTIMVDGSQDEFAVNLASSESRTASLDQAELERLGLPVGQAMTTRQLQRRQHQWRDTELESRQQNWRWLLATTLVVLGLETYVAGRMTQQQVPVSSQ